MKTVEADEAGREAAIAALARGEVIVYPTETLYGLGCDAADEAAVARVFRMKGRRPDKPLPLIAGDLNSVADLAVIPFKVMGLAALWPGPLTLILKASRELPPGLTDGQGRVAIRVSSHPVARYLAKRLGRPVVATSANRTGEQPAATADRAAAGLADDPPDLVVDGGPVPGGPPSTIVDATVYPVAIVRPGAMAEDQIELAVGKSGLAAGG